MLEYFLKQFRAIIALVILNIQFSVFSDRVFSSSYNIIKALIQIQIPANGPHYVAELTSHPFISVMSVFPGQTSEDLAKKSGPICSCDITIYVSTGHNPHYTDLT